MESCIRKALSDTTGYTVSDRVPGSGSAFSFVIAEKNIEDLEIITEKNEIATINSHTYTVIEYRQVPMEYNISQIWKQLNKLDISENHKRMMFMAPPQSGKSALQFNLMWYSCFVLKQGTVHLLMERIDSLLQNISRDFVQMCNLIEKICKKLKIPNPGDYMFNYKPFTKYALDRVTESRFTSSYTVHVAIATVAQLKRVWALDPTARQTIISDEADIFIKQDNKPVTTLIQSIMGDAIRRYECTASPFTNFNESNQVYDAVHILKPKPVYRGIAQCQHHQVSKEDMTALTPILEEIFTNDTGTFKNITLVNIDSSIVIQNKTKNLIEQHFGEDNVYVYVINSQAKIARPISVLMDSIANNPDPRPVVIIAGFMAARAVTYRTSKGSAVQAILTAMVYQPAKKVHQTSMIQAMRICGNYDPEYPIIHIYTTPIINAGIVNSFDNSLAITHSIKPGHESRKCLEMVPIKGCRKFSGTDDTKKYSVNTIEFKTLTSAYKFIKNNKKLSSLNVVATSDGLQWADTPSFTYGVLDRAMYQSVRSSVKNGGNTHIAWHEDRYQDLFSIKKRIDNPHYQVCEVTCGNPSLKGIQHKIPYITWVPGYEDVTRWDSVDTVYMYQTTKNTYKIWVKEEYKRLTH